MEPTRIRARILDEHERLRARLAQLEDRVLRLMSDCAPPLGGLVAEVMDLLEDFIGHTELEDRLLSPALLDADAWGPVRAAQLRDSHVVQRRELRDLLAVFDAGVAAADLRARTLRWIASVRQDMCEEEQTVLSRALLRDDVVALAMEAG